MDGEISPDWRGRARRRMTALRIGVTELAKAAGYKSHVQTSQHLAAENPRRPSWATLRAYAELLQCSAGWLARGEGEPPAADPARPEIFHAFGTESPKLATLGQRALYVRATTALNQAEFARRLSNTGLPVSRQAIRKIESDEVSDPSCKILCAYEELTGLRVRWILWGRGEHRALGQAATKEGIDPHELETALTALQEAEKNPLIGRLPIRSKAEMLRIIMSGAEIHSHRSTGSP